MKKLTATDIPVRDFPIDDMPHLKERLGKAGTARIRYQQEHPDSSPQRGSKNIPNTLLQFMQDKQPNDPGCWVDDIVQGVARADDGSRQGLNVDLLYALLQCLELINTREVMKMLQVDKRQAQKYVKALQLILRHVEAHRTQLAQNA